VHGHSGHHDLHPSAQVGSLIEIYLRKRESPKKLQLARGKIAASVLLKLFINGNERSQPLISLAHEQNSVFKV